MVLRVSASIRAGFDPRLLLRLNTKSVKCRSGTTTSGYGPLKIMLSLSRVVMETCLIFQRLVRNDGASRFCGFGQRGIWLSHGYEDLEPDPYRISKSGTAP